MSSLVYPRFVIFVAIILSLTGVVLSAWNPLYFLISLVGGALFGGGLAMLDSARNGMAYRKYLKGKQRKDENSG